MRRVLAFALLAVMAPAAHAGTVTVGPATLTDTATEVSCSAMCSDTVAISELQTSAVAPGRGRVTAWRVIGKVGVQGTLKLVVASFSGTSATSRALSGPATDLAGGGNAVDLPIEMGDAIGVSLCRCQSQATAVDYAAGSGTELAFTQQNGFTAAGQTQTGGAGSGRQFQLNATVVLAPSLASLSPTRGVRGTAVVITGRDLDGATAVRFGDQAADSFTVDSPTQITATAPVGVNGSTVPVTVIGPGGTSNELTFDYRGAPVVNTAAPNHGPAAGGNQVVLSGFSLDGATSVKFGDAPSTLFNAESSNTIRAAVPSGVAGGTVQIVVTTPSGVSNPVPYRYDPPPDTTGPVISALTVSQGTILYEVDEAGTVTFTLQRKLRGYKVKGKCRTKRKRKAKRCTILKAAGTPFTDTADKSGTNLAPLRAKGLKAGSYVLTAVARDAAGNAGKPRRTSLKLKP